MRIIKLFIAMLFMSIVTLQLSFLLAVPLQNITTIKDEMSFLEKNRGVNFVYDADLSVNRQYKGKSIREMKLDEALKNLFAESGIVYKVNGKYVLLQKVSATHKRHTISGYMYQTNGESLINGTLIDMDSHVGTITNSYGFFSLTLPEGMHRLCFSYVGFQEEIKNIELNKDIFLEIHLKNVAALQDIVVIGKKDTPLNVTQTGKTILNNKDLNTEFNLLSSPDLVKKLQMQAGVTSGTELISGLFVHGGKNDENLFLLDGTPLYQINHLGGLFSSFNTEVVKNVDFYKSGFPARYSGRLSSVVDVRTLDGDMKEFHGSYSIGMLDGRLHFEGPIKKDKTSFIFGIRRSWADIPLKIAYALSKNKKNNADYFFHDINAKVTHHFSDKSKGSISVYSGRDKMNLNSKGVTTISNNTDDGVNELREDDKENVLMDWGNFTASANWQYQLTPKLFSDITAVYTHNQSKYNYYDDELTQRDGVVESVWHKELNNNSTIDDWGYRMNFDYRPVPKHHIRFGSNYLYHQFRPINSRTLDYEGDINAIDTLRTSGYNHFTGHEITLYGEDDMALSDRWQANLGVNNSLFYMDGKWFHSIEPRVSLKYQLNMNSSLRLSYTNMTQFMHQISCSYLNLPTDYWVGSTRKIDPMRSWQLAAGYYSCISPYIDFSVEGYYKAMNHNIEFFSSGLMPDAKRWEYQMVEGKGRSYGLELALSYKKGANRVDVAYTLSKTERNFEDIYKGGWYPDKYDNRHRFDISWHCKVSKKMDFYSAWTFHSGNRMSVPTQSVSEPIYPDVLQYYIEKVYIYEKPNNFTLPSYHRLDIGANFNHVTKKGHERIWNISIYNVYCRMNPLFADIKENSDGTIRCKNLGIFPIIPSFSYTYKF